MAVDIVTLALAKKYTKKSLVGLGALKGSPCEVKKIESNDKKTSITMQWKGTDGTIESKSFDIYNGKGIVNISIDKDAHLKVLLSDGEIIDAGLLPGMEGNVTPEERERWNNKQDKLVPTDTIKINNDNEISVNLETMNSTDIISLF